jgi:hypothetical protein
LLPNGYEWHSEGIGPDFRDTKLKRHNVCCLMSPLRARKICTTKAGVAQRRSLMEVMGLWIRQVRDCAIIRGGEKNNGFGK